jgi:hypothetical protein
LHVEVGSVGECMFYLYWFRSLEHNTLHPVWVSVCSIDHGELDLRAHNGGIIRLGVLGEEVVVPITRVFFWAREHAWAA